MTGHSELGSTYVPGGWAGWLRPPVATKLTQSPWFLNTPKFRQPLFMHWFFEVGSGLRTVMAITARNKLSSCKGFYVAIVTAVSPCVKNGSTL